LQHSRHCRQQRVAFCCLACHDSLQKLEHYVFYVHKVDAAHLQAAVAAAAAEQRNKRVYNACHGSLKELEHSIFYVHQVYTTHLQAAAAAAAAAATAAAEQRDKQR
jgi:hypothetical protein